MSLKICFNNEIHKIAKAPTDLDDLKAILNKLFANTLPEFYNLHYEDSDSDKIILSNKEDYNALIESELGGSSRAVKVFISENSDKTGHQKAGAAAKEAVVEEKKEEKLTEAQEKQRDELRVVFRALLKESMPDIISGVKDAFKDCCKPSASKPAEEPKQKVEEPKAEEPKQNPVSSGTEPTKQAPVKEEPKPVVAQYSYEFVKDASTIPQKPTIKDLVIYKTIAIKNNGSTQWPKSCFLISKNEVKGQTAKLTALAPGKEMTAILIINSPQKYGDHESAWNLAYKNESEDTVKIGETFTVKFSIADPSAPKVDAKSEPEEIPLPKLTKQFESVIMDKAKKMKDMFPDADVDNLCEFI
jgi:hypothetical protein